MAIHAQCLGVMCLFALLYYNVHAFGCNGASYYATEHVCQRSYGTELQSISGSMSAIACSRRCATRADCRSFTFDADARLCSINAEESTSFADGCATKVLYGYVKKATCRDQWLYGPCSSNADCTVPNSYCRDSICTCNIGYPYTHRSDSCVTDCTDGYGTEFSSHPGALSGFNDEVVSVTSVAECQALCVAATSFTCRSIDYVEAASFDCFLSSETAVTQPAAYYAESYTTSLRNCA